MKWLSGTSNRGKFTNRLVRQQSHVAFAAIV